MNAPKSTLTADDIKPGRWYRAKRPAIARNGMINDRYVVFIAGNRTQVQYDGPAVPLGSHYPMVSMEQFLQWAGCECEEPEGYA